jgi:hypothetical protein
MAGINNPGEDKAWEIIGTLKPADVCRAASVGFDAASASYQVTSFGMNFIVSVRDKKISSTAPGSDVLLGKLGSFFRLSVRFVSAGHCLPATQTSVKRRRDLPGSHVLPLMSRRSEGPGRLYRREKLGGEIMAYGVLRRLCPCRACRSPCALAGG